jgi:hypothetical protein
VVIEAPHRHSQHGSVYGVRVDITVPGDERYFFVLEEPGNNEIAGSPGSCSSPSSRAVLPAK